MKEIVPKRFQLVRKAQAIAQKLKLQKSEDTNIFKALKKAVARNAPALQKTTALQPLDASVPVAATRPIKPIGFILGVTEIPKNTVERKYSADVPVFEIASHPHIKTSRLFGKATSNNAPATQKNIATNDL